MRIYIALLGTVCLLLACSTEEKNASKIHSKVIWQTEATAFLSSETNLISFGVVDINQLLTKSIYDSELSESGLVPLDMIDDYSKVIRTDLPIYYAVKSDTTGDLTDAELVVVCKIKDPDLAFETMNKDFQIGELIHENDVKFILENDIKIGLTKSEMIFLISENITNDQAKFSIHNTIEALQSNKTNKDIREIITAQEDIISALNIEAVQKFVSSVSQTGDLESNKNMTGTITMRLSFEKGRVIMTNKNYLSKEFTECNLFAENSKQMLSKLGAGSPIAALTLSLDLEGLEKLKRQYLPKSISNTIQDSDLDPSLKNLVPKELSVIEAFIQKDGIQNYINGNLALGQYSNDSIHSEYSIYLGIGKGFAQILKNEFNPMRGFFHSLEIDDTKMELYTSKENGQQNWTNTLQLKPEFKDLGGKPISAFLDIERHPFKELLLNDKVSKRIAELLKHVTLNADLEGGELIITMKDEQTNAITQIANLIPSLILGSIFQ